MHKSCKFNWVWLEKVKQEENEFICITYSDNFRREWRDVQPQIKSLSLLPSFLPVEWTSFRHFTNSLRQLCQGKSSTTLENEPESWSKHSQGRKKISSVRKSFVLQAQTLMTSITVHNRCDKSTRYKLNENTFSMFQVSLSSIASLNSPGWMPFFNAKFAYAAANLNLFFKTVETVCEFIIYVFRRSSQKIV